MTPRIYDASASSRPPFTTPKIYTQDLHPTSPTICDRAYPIDHDWRKSVKPNVPRTNFSRTNFSRTNFSRANAPKSTSH
ncbi:pentapeptide repeat-containing protein [Alkalinema pantanalense]|uniref:pentapeptide repeat-containing protein n=1 Tax=Alkalinema pantanalense TaxID=1620705 RepID=UPI003D6E5CF8